MRLMITGVCGFVGATIARSLREAFPDWNLFGIDSLCRAGSWTNRRALQELDIEVIHGDIRCQADVQSLPQSDWVLDAAANPSVLAGVDGRTSSLQLVQHNLGGTVNLLEYCKRWSAGFALMSTSRVYSIRGLADLTMDVVDSPCEWLGGAARRFQPSADCEFPPGIGHHGVTAAYSTQPPVSLYGSTKVCSEHLALEYGQTFEFPVWINRCGVLAGAGQFAHPAQGIFAFWIHSFRENRPLRYIGFDGGGHQVRDCLHPRDLVPLLQSQFQEPLDSGKPRIVNVSGGLENSMSLCELTAWCRNRFPDSRDSLPLASPDSRRFDIPWMVLDRRNAAEVWGWEPHVSVAEVLEEIADFADRSDGWLSVTV